MPRTFLLFIWEGSRTRIGLQTIRWRTPLQNQHFLLFLSILGKFLLSLMEAGDALGLLVSGSWQCPRCPSTSFTMQVQKHPWVHYQSQKCKYRGRKCYLVQFLSLTPKYRWDQLSFFMKICIFGVGVCFIWHYSTYWINVFLFFEHYEFKSKHLIHVFLFSLWKTDITIISVFNFLYHPIPGCAWHISAKFFPCRKQWAIQQNFLISQQGIIISVGFSFPFLFFSFFLFFSSLGKISFSAPYGIFCNRDAST